MVNLLRGPSDDKQFEVWVAVWWRLTRYFHKCTGLLVDGLDILSSSANDKPAFVSRNGEGHLSSRRTPVPLASTPSSPTRRHSCTRTWGALWRKHNTTCFKGFCALSSTQTSRSTCKGTQMTISDLCTYPLSTLLSGTDAL